MQWVIFKSNAVLKLLYAVQVVQKHIKHKIKILSFLSWTSDTFLKKFSLHEQMYTCCTVLLWYVQNTYKIQICSKNTLQNTYYFRIYYPRKGTRAIRWSCGILRPYQSCSLNLSSAFHSSFLLSVNGHFWKQQVNKRMPSHG